MNELYRPPSEKKDFRAHRGPGGTCLKGQKKSYIPECLAPVSFEVAEGWDAKQIASELNRIAEEGMKIEDYRSYGVQGNPKNWGISIYTKRAGTLFVLKDSRDHEAIDNFFRSVRYGNFRFVSATANRQTITLTREPEA